MRIQCPSCQAAYDVANVLLDPPRVVRCAKCGHDWMAVALDEPGGELGFHEEPAPNPAPEVHQPVDEQPEEPNQFSALRRLAAEQATPPPRRTGWLLPVAWVASIAAIFTLAGAVYVERDTITHHWPASKRVLGAFGLSR